MRVLSIDGGGSFGILPARFLAELESITRKSTAELFDVIAGTATGAIVALSLTVSGANGRARHTAEDLLELFATQGRDLVLGRWAGRWHNRMRRRGRIRGAIDQLSEVPDAIESIAQRRHPIAQRDRWSSEPLTYVLQDYLGDAPFGRARSRVIVPTYDLNAAEPLIFDSEDFEPYTSPLMREVASASSAVPSRLPPVRLQFGGVERALVHGGLASNNPVILAYAAALSRVPAEEISVVSLGAGSPARARVGFRSTLAPWHRAWPRGARRAFSAFLHSSGDAQHHMLQALLPAGGHGRRYWRIQMHLSESAPTVAVPERSDPALLREVADEMLDKHQPELSEIAEELVT